MILPADPLSNFAVVIYVEKKITSISMIDQKESAIIPRVSYYSMRCGNKSLTQKIKGEKQKF